jgi:sugar phosphate isomerase/epimerase
VKIALAIAPQDAIPSSFVVFRDRLDNTIPKIARMGYDGVELALGHADDVDRDEVRHLLADHHLGISAISTGRVFAERHVTLTSPKPGVRAHAIEILCGLVDLAAELGAARVNIGRVRGGIPGDEAPELGQARFEAGILEVADHAAPLRVNLVVEPVNRYELNYINSVSPDGVELVRRIGHPNVKLMPDVFHMNIEDADIAGSLLAAGPMVGYCHLADSNRWAPGRAHTDFAAIVAALRQIGYDDWVAVEILPYPSADAAAEEAIAFLRTLVPVAVA